VTPFTPPLPGIDDASDKVMGMENQRFTALMMATTHQPASGPGCRGCNEPQ
jgi:hypothetical protein